MLPPHVGALEVVLARPGAHSDVVDGLLVDQLDLLVLGQDGRESLQNFLAGEPRKRAPKGLLVQKVGVINDA